MSPIADDVFNVPPGMVIVPDDGRWWASRDSTGLEESETVTVLISDGRAMAKINGTPAALRRVAEAIVAQIESAEANTVRSEPAPPLTDFGNVVTMATSLDRAYDVYLDGVLRGIVWLHHRTPDGDRWCNSQSNVKFTTRDAAIAALLTSGTA